MSIHGLDIILLSVSENKRPPNWNSTPGFDFTVASLSTWHPASIYQISSKSDHTKQSYDTFSRLRHRSSTLSFVFGDFAQLGRSTFTSRPNFGEISQSKIDISLLSSMLKFYSRFQFSPMQRYRHEILRHSAKFHPNRAICCRGMTS